MQEETYCTHCQVIPALPGEELCEACLNELLEAMAECWEEIHLMGKGLY